MEMGTVERMIFHAVRAGAFRAAARDFTDARATFEAAADVNSTRVAALADQIAMAPTLLRRVDRT